MLMSTSGTKQSYNTAQLQDKIDVSQEIQYFLGVPY